MVKMRMFLRQSTVGREPLAIAMSGVRMGERLLQIGIDAPVVTGLLAAKPGLSGESSIVVADEATAEKARRAVAETSANVDIHVHALSSLPFGGASFDLVVINNRSGETLSAPTAPSMLAECRRVLRSGGRVVVIGKGSASGLAALFQSRKGSDPPDAPEQALQRAGFRAVRMLGDRDGYRFVEGLHVAG
jgi:ubiquinone/menaquinone biosynthesis C-methylase UbiE